MTGIVMLTIQVGIVMCGFYGVAKGMEKFYSEKGVEKNVNKPKNSKLSE